MSAWSAGALEVVGGVDRAGQHQDRVGADGAGVCRPAGLCPGGEAERLGGLGPGRDEGTAAPSEICEAVPAVWTPSSRTTGFRPAKALHGGLGALVTLRRGGSCPWACRPSPDQGASFGDVLGGKRSSAHAWAPAPGTARRERSTSSRVIPLVGDALGALRLGRPSLLREVALRDGLATPWPRLEPMGRRGSLPRPGPSHPGPPRATGWWPRRVACWDDHAGCRPWWPRRLGRAAVSRSAGHVEGLLAHLADRSHRWPGRPRPGRCRAASRLGLRPQAGRPSAWWAPTAAR